MSKGYETITEFGERKFHYFKKSISTLLKKEEFFFLLLMELEMHKNWRHKLLSKKY